MVPDAGVTDLIERAMRERLAELGEVESGLFRYYSRKLQHDTLLSECDLGAVRLLRASRGRFRREWDIGSGVGQLPLALAADGWQVFAIEHDKRRFGALTAVIDAVTRSQPHIGRRVQPVFGSFPEVTSGNYVGDDVVIALNAAFSATEEKYRAFEDRLRKYGAALIDFPRLFTETKVPSDWRARAEAYAGIPQIAPAYDYRIPEEDKTGEVYFLTRPRQ